MQPVAFDAVDLKIIAILQADGRRSYSAIAEELDLPASSVRYRVQRLIDSGFLQIVGIADPLAIGFEHLAMIGIRTKPATARAVCAALKELPETSYVIMTAGHYDVMAEVICRDVRHFSELMAERLQTIPGIVSTESFFALEVHKLAYGWGVGNVATAFPERRMAVSPAIDGPGAVSLPVTGRFVRRRQADGVVTVELVGAKSVNILGSEATQELTAEFRRLAREDDCRVIVLRGAGDKAFIGGADINEMAGLDQAAAEAFISRLAALCEAVRACPAPVIARLSGWCLGAGLEVAVSCDLRVAGAGAVFGMPEVAARMAALGPQAVRRQKRPARPSRPRLGRHPGASRPDARATTEKATASPRQH